MNPMMNPFTTQDRLRDLALWLIVALVLYVFFELCVLAVRCLI